MKQTDGLRLHCAAAQDRVFCASSAMQFADRHGFARRSCWEIAIAVAELSQNLARHAGSGEINIGFAARPRPAIVVVCSDFGPGFDDVHLALQDRYSRGRRLAPEASPSDGLGMGLGAVIRLMSEMHIDSRRGRGSVVTAIKYRDP